MKLIGKKTKSRYSFFEDIPAGIQSITDSSKLNYISSNISAGLSNRIIFEKFIDFQWPLWLERVSNFLSSDARSYPNPLLLNTSYREWQVFTNYLSNSEITIDRAGMISGPSGARWSIEFWIYSDGVITRPQDDPERIKLFRDIKTGEIVSLWETDSFSFAKRIAGSRSSIDEALVSVELNFRKKTPDSYLVAALRPYNNTLLGGVSSIDVDTESGIVSFNGKGLFGFESKPDNVVTGSGIYGDILSGTVNSSRSISCSFGMASAGIVYSIGQGKKTFNFRVSLNSEAQLPSLKVNYINQFKEFGLFSEIRLLEGVNADLTDSGFTNAFNQAKLSLLNINSDDISENSPDSFRKLYYFVYALCRSGSLSVAEKLFNIKLESAVYNRKQIEFQDIINGCFLIKACYEIFIHKRETAFLQSYYPSVKSLADYIYKFSVELHSASGIRISSNAENFAVKDGVADTFYIFSAVSNLSYLARCMGIFGDEAKFKNESIRLQSLITDFIVKNSSTLSGLTGIKSGLLSLPEKVLNSISTDDYRVLISSIAETFGFPVLHPLYGIDMLSSAVMLNQFIESGLNVSNRYYSDLMTFTDELFIIPEYVELSSRRGTWGDGNSKMINAVFFAFMRNRLFIDGAERLELFPVADPSWFINGGRISVENAASRYGIISFNADITDSELRISFGGSPKYLPPDIMINIPYDTDIIQGDDFIVKKKIGNSYLINGWPSAVRFSTSK